MLKITQTMINQHSILIDLRSKLIEIPTEQKECLHHLSYPFIPFLDENFYSSKNKVLLVGQETKGWQSRLSNFLNEDINFDTVIQNSVRRHQELYSQSPKHSSFLQFLKKIKIQNHQEPIQWLNFYLFDYKKASFNTLSKNKTYKDIFLYLQELSILNLSQQIKDTQPRVIFFVGQYHNNFPKLEEKLHLTSNDRLLLKEPIDKFSMKIWNDEILILRVPHPAHFSRISNQARNVALEYFKIFDQCETMAEFKEVIHHKLK
ncbi:hypothetical protein [Acinetobacter sp. YH12235]|uniref:hypothetical protein n=1 Tax=Acinetobacter sp. YH12235 TaxID=2601162 RepID=UPI00211DF3EA|nr:hypothetical protein [Acinetobacter sp. YH12235]